ncbi:MAG: hypothetical protein JKY08_11470 [Flavobacteriaceae bacterium]|nr:hypothetical protein [Flavobacteriaceae bacterium]
MKNVFLIIVSSLVMFGCKDKIEFEFFEKIDIEKKIEYPSKLVSKKEQLVHIFSQKHKPLYSLKDYINYENFDFDKYDYLLVFGKELLNVKPTKDDCDYLSKTPIKVNYKIDKKENNSIYVYKFFDKNKYRDLCP